MPNDTEITFKVITDATSGIAGMKQVEIATKNMESQTATVLGNMKGNYLAVAAVAAAAAATIVKAAEYIEQGVRLQQTQEAFRHATEAIGSDATRMIEELKRVTNNTVDDSDMMQKAMKAMSAGMSEDKVVKIAEVSRLAARRMGVDVGEAYSSIIDAVETMRTKSLRAYGLITPAQQELINKVKATGVEYDIMKLVMLNYERQAEIVGRMTENTAERFQQMKVRFKEAKDEIADIVAKLWDYIYVSAKVAEQAGRPGAAPTIPRVGAGGSSAAYGAMQAQLYPNEPRAGNKSPYGYSLGSTDVSDVFASQESATKSAADRVKEEEKRLEKLGLKNTFDELAKAQLEWKRAIDALNPNIGAEAREIQQLTYRAEIMKQAWSAKKMDTSWIDGELTRGVEFIKQKQEQERALKQLSEAAKREQESKKAAYETEKVQEEMGLKMLEERLSAEQTLANYQVKFNEVSAGQAEAVRYQNNLTLLKAQADEKLRLIDLQLKYNWETEEGEKEGTRLAQEYLILQEQIAQAEKLRYYSAKEIYLLELQKERELLDIAIQRKDYQRSIWEYQWAGIMSTANNVGGEAGKGAGMMAAGVKGFSDIAAGTDIYTQRYDAALKREKEVEEQHKKNLIGRFEAEEEYSRLSLQQEQALSDQKYAMVSNTFGMMAGAAYSYYAMTGQQSEAAFIAYKAFAAAEATITGIKATINAYEWGSKYGGPVLGAIMAGIAATATGMYVASILSASPPTTNATAAVPSSAGGYSYVQPTVPQYEKTETKPSQVINVHIYGNVVDQDKFAREMLPSIRKAVSDGA